MLICSDSSVDPNTPNGFNARLKTGSLKDLHWHAQCPGGRILNCLELPNSTGCSEPHHAISTDTVAWSHTIGKPLCKKHLQKPVTDIRWGLAATAGAISYWHLDTNGFATYIDVKVGQKWWVVAEPKEGGPSFGSKDFYSQFDCEKVNEELWDVYAVLLKPGQRL